MATNVIPFPLHRVKLRPEITEARDHIAHLTDVIPSLTGIALFMAEIVLERRQADLRGLLDGQNDNIIPLRRA